MFGFALRFREIGTSPYIILFYIRAWLQGRLTNAAWDSGKPLKKREKISGTLFACSCHGNFLLRNPMMSFVKHALAGAILVACTLYPLQAVRAASSTIEITGTVSVICKINGRTQQTLSGAQIDLGSITEFCNSPGGYQVWVDYAPGVGGQTLYVDGRAVPLSESGSTMIDSSASASVQSRSLTMTGTGALTSLSMRIMPL